MTDVTVILNAITSGRATTEDLLPLVYSELRQLAAVKMKNEPAGITLQATALVHEAFLRLVGDNNASWESRRHFLGAAAIAMQRIMVEQARQRQQLKRGGQLQQVELPDFAVAADLESNDLDLLALDDAITAFESEDSTKAELVRLRYFVGLNEEETAQALNISRSTAARWWAFAKARLYLHIQGDSE